METIHSDILGRDLPRIGIGTWSIGGWMWGGTDEEQGIRTIQSALDRGLTLIDTAPIYNFGRAEELVGTAWKGHVDREKIVIATKVALEWNEAKDTVRRNSSPSRLRKEIEDSLRRLKTDYVDIYQIHWPDEGTPFEQTAEVLHRLLEEGKIRSIGVSNFSPVQMDAFRKGGPLHFSQPPYNLFESGVGEDVLPYCKKNRIFTLTYGVLCRGLLSGTMTKDRSFPGDDLRQVDPKFVGDRFNQYLDAVDRLKSFADQQFKRSVLALAMRWVLDSGADILLWGGRKPDQLAPIDEGLDWSLSPDDKEEIQRIVNETVTDPVGPEFMAPPP